MNCFADIFPGISESLLDVQSKLLDALLGKYDKRILPQHNASDPVPLSIGIRLLNLVELVSIASITVFILGIGQICLSKQCRPRSDAAKRGV